MVTVLGLLGRRSGLWFLLLAFVLLWCARPAVAGYEAGKNDNNDDNGLGLLAKTCAESFCRSGVQGLDLWISLEETCSLKDDKQPYMGMLAAKPDLHSAIATSTSTSNSGGDWSFITTIMVCAGVWVASMYAGYQTGSKIGTQTKGGYPVV